ncbi:hypothetical protein RB653_001479 [Dictyostelium firmibasis]|uniref:Uncharacterized protein n=1 Tax=Dictyostelium firmibasis TaxID=79012 RepID=A0AAN7YVC6_9MYCE
MAIKYNDIEEREEIEDDLARYVDGASNENNNVIISSDQYKHKYDENIQLNNNDNNKNNNNSYNDNYQDIKLNDLNTNNNKNNEEDYYINQSIISRIYYFFKDQPSSLYNTVHCAIGFLFIFFGYSPTQSLITNLHQNNGSIGLALLYFSFAIGCFIAPVVLKKIGLIKSLTIAGITYGIFIFCSITGVAVLEGLFLPASILIGFGAGLLWTSQPVYVSRNAPTEKELGLYSGMFQTIYSIGSIVGNAISGTLQNEDVNPTIILSILGSSTFFGCIILAFLRRVDPIVPTPRKTLSKTFTGAFMIFKDRKFLFLIPLLIVQGQSQSYFYETFNGIIGLDRVGFISVTMGIVSVIGSSIWGRVHDKVKSGKKLLAIIMGILYLISLTLLSFANYFDQIPMFYVIAAINGMFDSLQTILIFVTIASLYPNDNVSAFSASRFLMSISTGIAFFVFHYLNFFVVIFWILALLIVAQICYHNLLQEIKSMVKLPNDDDYDTHTDINKFNLQNQNTNNNFNGNNNDNGYELDYDDTESNLSFDDNKI